jgi:YHS domain-containing protein
MSSALSRCEMHRALLILALAAVACGGASSKGPIAPAKAASEMRTIDTGDVHPAIIEPPPTVTDIGPAPKPKANVAQADAPPPPTPEDEALRNNLPFAPAIAMDPVDGSKISIRANTPMVDMKNRIYYFSSDANKKIFLANPDQFTKGLFSHL